MNLYLIHTGYYDKNIGGGFYEQHTNIFIAAKSPYEARELIKKNKEYINKKMHIDGIKEINNIDGYDIQIKKTKKKEDVISYNHYQVRFLKSDK